MQYIKTKSSKSVCTRCGRRLAAGTSVAYRNGMVVACELCTQGVRVATDRQIADHRNREPMCNVATSKEPAPLFHPWA